MAGLAITSLVCVSSASLVANKQVCIAISNLRRSSIAIPIGHAAEVRMYMLSAEKPDVEMFI